MLRDVYACVYIYVYIIYNMYVNLYVNIIKCRSSLLLIHQFSIETYIWNLLKRVVRGTPALPEICRPEGSVLKQKTWDEKKKTSPSHPLSKFLTAQCRENIQCFFLPPGLCLLKFNGVQNSTEMQAQRNRSPSRREEWLYTDGNSCESTEMMDVECDIRRVDFVFKFWNAKNGRFIGFLPLFQVSNNILSAACNLPARWWYASIAAWLLGKFVYAYHIYIGLNNFYATSCQYM